MGLISEYVEVPVDGRTIKYYESLGYDVPKIKNKNGDIKYNCGAKFNVKTSDLKPHSATRVMVECDNCNKKYDVAYSVYVQCNRNGLYYCQKCATKLFISGSNHWLWNDSITQEERILKRRTKEYINFTKTVLCRDNYSCVCCNSNEKLQVHHLDGYNWYIEGRTNPNNGITLCEKCHHNFHSIYGEGNNTKEQFEEWIGCDLENIKDICVDDIPEPKKIYCFEEDIIYDSARDFSDKHNISIAGVYRACNRDVMIKNSKTYNIYTCCGFHLFWLDEYQSMTDCEINNIINTKPKYPNSIKVIHVETNTEYNSVADAEKDTLFTRYKIYRSINKKIQVENINGEFGSFILKDNSNLFEQ